MNPDGCVKCDKDKANIRGTGRVSGNFYAKDIHKFIELQLFQRNSFILCVNKIENFCSVFDLDFRFREHTEISTKSLVGFAVECKLITKEVTGKDVTIMVTRKQKLCYPKKDHFGLRSQNGTQVHLQ